MKKLITSLLIIPALILQANILESPDGKLKMNFELSSSGEPVYSLHFQNKTVIKPSKMGFIVRDHADLSSGFVVRNTSRNTVDTVWETVWGEEREIRDHHHELLVELYQPAEKRTMKIRFRLFNDGLGFRYEFDKQEHLNYFRIEEELTEFAVTGNHKAFWMPGDFDTNEYFYTVTNISDIDASKVDGSGIGTHGYFHKDAVQTPLLLKTNEGMYISIFEAALIDYPAMHLMTDKQNYVFRAALSPDALGVKAYMQTPHNTPWRTVIVGNKATDILASRLILNLNEPNKIEDTSFIKPQKYIGIWWGMHVPDFYTWNYADGGNLRLRDTDWNALKPNGRHGATNENVRRYIDFAAEHGFEGVLVEGWNVGWEDWAFNFKEEVFDFVTPYPDFDIAALNAYAHSKGVKLIMHHETSSSVTNYERRLDEALDLMNKYGYEAVKTGYVGWIIPRGETHDGQWMVNHYQRVVEKLAERKIMLNAHEAARPTGQHRTWPNWLACESARGNEFNAWSIGNPPAHETILPFTRLLGGPMDYTPGIFEIKMSYYQPGNEYQVHSTLAKQLALYVTMYSPLQMAADLPENYEKRMDAFQFIKDVAVDWQKSLYLEAEPGEYLTIARKERDGDRWFMGAITGDDPRTTVIPLTFLDDKAQYVATIYGDAPDSHWKNNPMTYRIRTGLVNSRTKLKLELAAGGGAAISFRKAEGNEARTLRRL